MKQEQESDERLRAFDGMSRAAMPEALRQKIIDAMMASKGRSMAFNPLRRWLMAAGIALLAGINIYAVASRQRQMEASVVSAAPTALEQEYFAAPPSI